MAEGRFASVPTLFKGLFRMVEDGDAPRYCQGFAGVSDLSLKEEMLSQSRLPDAALRFLVEMDRKLDAVMGFLQRESLASDFPHEGRVVEISGDGVIFECREPLAPGDHMELLLMLEEFPPRVCSVIARVEEKGEGKAVTGSPNSPWKLSFARVQEEDREAVIRFVFREERKLIRLQKGE